MSRQLSEKQVLEMLGIPDFRHLSKDRIMSFTSALPQMEPQVAIAALQQVPHFADTSLEIMRIYKETVSQTLAEDQENVQSFNASCDMVLGLLETLSQNDDLSFEQKNELIDRMMAVLKMKSDKDTETKRCTCANGTSKAGGSWANTRRWATDPGSPSPTSGRPVSRSSSTIR